MCFSVSKDLSFSLDCFWQRTFKVPVQLFEKTLNFISEVFEFFRERFSSKLKLWFAFTGLVFSSVPIFHKTLWFTFSISRLLIFSFGTFSFLLHHIFFEHQRSVCCTFNVFYVIFHGSFKHFVQSYFIWVVMIDWSFFDFVDQVSKVSWRECFDTGHDWLNIWFSWDHNLLLFPQS